jgi:RNA recognition motif-containing protein
MQKKLFVGGLPFQTTQEELQNMFAEAGQVTSATIITDKMTGRSKGFGFVEMSTEEEAEKAIQLFNGKEVGGRKITVNEARPMEARAPRRSFGGGYQGGRGDR